jgi:hypothetical protein
MGWSVKVGAVFPLTQQYASAKVLEHDPEKCVAVFRKDHAQTLEHDPDGVTPRSRSRSGRS